MYTEITVQRKRRIAPIDRHAYDFQYCRACKKVKNSRPIRSKKKWNSVSPAHYPNAAMENRGDGR